MVLAPQNSDIELEFSSFSMEPDSLQSVFGIFLPQYKACKSDWVEIWDGLPAGEERMKYLILSSSLFFYFPLPFPSPPMSITFLLILLSTTSGLLCRGILRLDLPAPCDLLQRRLVHDHHHRQQRHRTGILRKLHHPWKELIFWSPI